jgi:glycosyltransferase involved in cell wall biosynthesis
VVREKVHRCRNPAWTLRRRGPGVIHGKKVVVVLPAYNAERTLRQTIADLPSDVVDDVLLVDDASRDSTVALARSLGLRTFVHETNLGYGGNQKTCYTQALKLGADVVVMVHPDYQYDPRLVTALASLIATDVYDVVLGSRIIGRGALQGGMPGYKWVANRVLTAFQNAVLGEKLSEYHTGYRAYARQVLEALPLEANDDDFVFDNQILAQSFYFGFRVGEVSCPTRYFPEASSINFRRSCTYGFGVVKTSLQYRAARLGLAKPRIFDPAGPRLGNVRLAGGLVVESPSPSLADGEASVGPGRGATL